MSAMQGAGPSLLGDNLRRILRRILGQETSSPATPSTVHAPGSRRSNGLREFWEGLEPEANLQILDFGSASQANISFVTGRGYKLYTADLLQSTMRAAPQAQQAETDASREEQFLRENLNFAEGQFDGVLCWDVFDFLEEPLAKPLVERLYDLVKPGSHLLLFFHTALAGQEVPLYQYRISAVDTLEALGRGSGTIRRSFNNRSIENLFRKFSSLKFYLSRDNLREVIIVR